MQQMLLSKLDILHLSADTKNFSKILSSLSSYNAKATFFIDQKAVSECENEIRRAIVQGHSIGILASSTEDLNLTNTKLFDVAKTKTRLVRFKNGSSSLSDEDVEEVISLGYRLWDADISQKGTSSSQISSNIMASLNPNSRTSVISLSDSDVGVSALSKLLKQLDSKNYASTSIHILDTPVNQRSDRR